MKEQFPIFQEHPDLLYFDSAATAHKPARVISAIGNFYAKEYASIHRGVYASASHATSLVEGVRKKVASFIHAKEEEIIFTHSTTESINLLAYSLESTLKEGDVVLVSIAEHHSNFLPWKELCRRSGATFVTFDICDDGSFDLEDFKGKLSSNTKIVAFSHESNVLGIENPVRQMVDLAHSRDALVVCDGAQVVAHKKVDMEALGVDFYAFSAHKMYGPTGVGVLYGKYHLLEEISPFHYGGGMVENVEEGIYRSPPYKFEAGTPMIASIIGLGAAVDFVLEVGFDEIAKVEREVSHYLYDNLEGVVDFITPLCRGSSILSFTIDGVHATDAGILLSLDDVCVRVGNMCAQPLLSRLGKRSIIRVSLGVYSTIEDAKRLIVALQALKQSVYVFKGSILYSVAMECFVILSSIAILAALCSFLSERSSSLVE